MWRTQLKMPFAMMIGSFITLGLFGVMHLLISGGPGNQRTSVTHSAIRFGQLKIEPPPPPIDRSMPTKPKRPEALPRPEKPLPVEIERTTTRMVPDFPGLELTTGTGGPSGPSLCGNFAVECSALTEDGEVVALARIQPMYPRRQALMGIEGFVTIEFTITATGSVIDARVINSEPRRVFDQSALRAIVKWKFRPRIINGKAVARRASQTLDFRLDQ
jgi:protein TonB